MPLECEVCGFEHGWVDVDEDGFELLVLCKNCLKKGYELVVLKRLETGDS